MPGKAAPKTTFPGAEKGNIQKGPAKKTKRSGKPDGKQVGPGVKAPSKKGC